MLVWRVLRERAAQFIDTAHKTHPERRGLGTERAAYRLGFNFSRRFSMPCSRSLPKRVCSRRIDNCASIAPRQPATGSKAAADKIRAVLATKPFDPPGSQRLSQGSTSTASDTVFDRTRRDHRNQRARLFYFGSLSNKCKRLFPDFISVNGPATASQLREKIGSSRRSSFRFSNISIAPASPSDKATCADYANQNQQPSRRHKICYRCWMPRRKSEAPKTCFITHRVVVPAPGKVFSCPGSKRLHWRP